MEFPKFKTFRETTLEIDYGALTREEVKLMLSVLKTTKARFTFYQTTSWGTEKGKMLFGKTSVLIEKNAFQIMMRE